MDCLTCKSISGEKRISPGPTIFEGEHWRVEHAYPCGIKGWLVIVLKRHVEALHDLTSGEFSELARLVERTAGALRATTGCKKEYVACFGEAPGFNHVHVHVVARANDLPQELLGPGILNFLKVTAEEAVGPDEIKAFCEQMQGEFSY